MKNDKREPRCPECGGHIVRTAKAGRTMSHRNVAALAVPAALEIPTCSKCGEMFLDARTSELLDDALDMEYGKLLASLAQLAIEKLATKVKKQDLERLIGVSQGYLSKLPEKATSPILVTLLSLLAADPEHNIAIARSLWEPLEKVV